MSRTRTTPKETRGTEDQIIDTDPLTEVKPDWFVWDSATFHILGPYTKEKAKQVAAEFLDHKDPTFSVVQLPV